MASEMQILNSLEAFASVEREWRTLQESAASPNVYFTFESLYATLARGQARRLSIAIARDNGRLVAALPLWQPSPHLPILEPIGAVPGNDPPVVAGHEQALGGLVRRMLEIDPRRTIVIRNIRADSPLASLSEARVMPQKNPELFTSIAGDFESFVLRHFQRKSRNKVRRYAEQFRRAGATFELVTEPTAVIALAHQLAPFKWQVLKGRYNTSAVCSAEGRAFLGELAKAGLLRGYSLNLDGRLVAGCLCQVHRGVSWYWIPAYSPDFVRWSPGIALLYLMLEHAHQEGLRELNYGYGEQMYKEMWASGSRPLVTCEIAADTLQAHAVLQLRHTLDRARAGARTFTVLQKLHARIQWVRTRRERAVIGGGPGRAGGVRSLLARVRGESLRPPLSVRLVLRAGKLAADPHSELCLKVVGTSDYRRVASMRPWEAPAIALEHFRHGDTCFVAHRHNVDVHVSFVDWKPPAELPAGYAHVNRAFTVPMPGRWDTHCEVLRRISLEARARGKLGIVCSFDASDAALLRHAARVGFVQDTSA